jgi:hypothetical protein
MAFVEQRPIGDDPSASLYLADVRGCDKSVLHCSPGSATCGGVQACDSDEDVASTLFRELTSTDDSSTPIESAFDPTGAWYEDAIVGNAGMEPAVVPVPAGAQKQQPMVQRRQQQLKGSDVSATASCAAKATSSSSRSIPFQKELTSMDLSAGLAEEASKDTADAWYDLLKEPPTQTILAVREAAEKERRNHDSAREALLEMGFDAAQAQAGLERMHTWGGDVQEAANWLAEQAAADSVATWSSRPQSCTQAISSFVAAWICPCVNNTASDTAELESFRPGRYRIIVGHASSSCAQAGQTMEQVEEGSIVEVVEVLQPAATSNSGKGGSNVVRGRLDDGRWISIASTTGRQSHIWAKPIDVETQLVLLGFPEDCACEAARRCSTVEAAVDYLASSSGSNCSVSLRLRALQHVQQMRSRLHRAQVSGRSQED